MQTIYYTTSNYIRHTGNLVDLTEYRRRRTLVQEGSLAPQLEPEEKAAPQRPALTALPAVRPRRSTRRERSAWVLDACASLGVVVMTLAFTLQLLL